MVVGVLILLIVFCIGAGWQDFYSELTSVATNDLVVVQDVSDTTDDSNGTTKYATADNLVKAVMPAPGTIGGTTPAAATFTEITVSKTSGVAGKMGVYEANSTDTSLVGFKGPASVADDLHYIFSNTDPAGYETWFFGAESSNESQISLSRVYDAIEIVLDGSGSVIETGVVGDIELPAAFEVERVTMLADQTGDIVIDIWVDTYANYPPTDADTITAAAVPTISSAVKSQDTSLSGWTTTLAAGSIIRYNVDSCTTIEQCTISLKGYWKY